jgi:hypothetical protein
MRQLGPYKLPIDDVIVVHDLNTIADIVCDLDSRKLIKLLSVKLPHQTDISTQFYAFLPGENHFIVIVRNPPKEMRTESTDGYILYLAESPYKAYSFFFRISSIFRVGTNERYVGSKITAKIASFLKGEKVAV